MHIGDMEGQTTSVERVGELSNEAMDVDINGENVFFHFVKVFLLCKSAFGRCRKFLCCWKRWKEIRKGKRDAPRLLVGWIRRNFLLEKSNEEKFSIQGKERRPWIANFSHVDVSDEEFCWMQHQVAWTCEHRRQEAYRDTWCCQMGWSGQFEKINRWYQRLY